MVSAMQSFILVLTNFPDVQKQGQAEVDRVLAGRLPTFADRPDLPLVVRPMFLIHPLQVADTGSCRKAYVWKYVSHRHDHLGPSFISFYQQVLRWSPITPLTLPRSVTKTHTYRGYTIPKGTTVHTNVWAALHDPERYPDPMTFKADRFLNKEKNARDGINPSPDLAFGVGRR